MFAQQNKSKERSNNPVIKPSSRARQGREVETGQEGGEGGEGLPM